MHELDQAEVFNVFEKSFDIEAARVESQNPPYPALWKIQQQQARGYLRDYLQSQYCDSLLDFESLNFEFGFGVGTRADHLDSASISDPVTISTSAGPVKLCGKIDRIDRVKTEGIEGLFVVDYKTGKIPSSSKSAGKQNLQMPLYTQAVEQIFNSKCLGGAYHSLTGKSDGYFGFKKSGGKIKSVDGFDQQRSEGMNTVGQFVTSMRQGRFDLHMDKPDTCKHCEFRQVCHFSPVRSEVKFSTSKTEEAK